MTARVIAVAISRSRTLKGRARVRRRERVFGEERGDGPVRVEDEQLLGLPALLAEARVELGVEVVPPVARRRRARHERPARRRPGADAERGPAARLVGRARAPDGFAPGARHGERVPGLARRLHDGARALVARRRRLRRRAPAAERVDVRLDELGLRRVERPERRRRQARVEGRDGVGHHCVRRGWHRRESSGHKHVWAATKYCTLHCNNAAKK